MPLLAAAWPAVIHWELGQSINGAHKMPADVFFFDVGAPALPPLPRCCSTGSRDACCSIRVLVHIAIRRHKQDACAART
jgi:hypothetical protein